MAVDRSELEAEIGTFVRQYGRTSRRQGDPNDRKHDKRIQRAIENLSPEELDRLMNGDDDS